MGLNRKSVQKMASLSALGAGAIALTADKAEASAIIYQTGIDLKVGFDCGCTGYQSSQFISLNFGALAGFAGMGFHTTYHYPGSSYNVRLFVLGFGLAYHAEPNTTGSGSHLVAGQFQFKAAPNSFPGSHTYNNFIGLYGAGAAWSTGPGVSGPFPVAQRFLAYNTSLYTTQSNSLFPSSATTGYALFKFDDPGCSGGTCYGWTQLKVAFTPNGPNVDILGWAYDTSGNPLPAGTVPEPSTLAMTGLAALALGAKGVRQWRKARKS